MLTKEEEARLTAVLLVTSSDIDKSYLAYKTEGVHWLATKLKEVNDELSQVTLELQKANKLNARLPERHE